MTDRRTELGELADRITRHDSVTDAWLAKSDPTTPEEPYNGVR